MEKAKIGFEIEVELRDRLNNVVPWGMTTKLFNGLTEQVVEILERSEDPNIVVAAIISKRITLEEILKLKNKS